MNFVVFTKLQVEKQSLDKEAFHAVHEQPENTDGSPMTQEKTCVRLVLSLCSSVLASTPANEL